MHINILDPPLAQSKSQGIQPTFVFARERGLRGELKLILDKFIKQVNI